MKKASLCLVVSIAIVLLQATSSFAVNPFYTERWDRGFPADWVQNSTKSNVGIVETGGNPGGYLRSSGTDLVNDSFDIGARTNSNLSDAVAGNYLEAGVIGVSVDIRFISGSFDGAWIRFTPPQATMLIGWVYPLTSTNQIDWQTFSVSFDPDWTDDEARAAGWLPGGEAFGGAASASFQETMANVNLAEVRISGVGDVEVGIDNFGLMCQDTDNDGLCDIEELFGIGALDLPGLGADPFVPDIFVEVDHMASSPPCEEKIREVIASFATQGINLHVDLGVAAPGTDLDLGGGNVIPEADVLAFTDFHVPGGAANSGLIFSKFDDVKTIHFDIARHPAFHYAVYASELGARSTTLTGATAGGESTIETDSTIGRNIPGVALTAIGAEIDGDRFTYTSLACLPNGGACTFGGIPPTGPDAVEAHAAGVRVSAPPGCCSGIGEFPGNDLIVQGGIVVSPCSQSTGAIFMHELGHNLALGHGGPELPLSDPRRPWRLPNRKPNYLSIMNYSFGSGPIQLGATGCTVVSQRLDYSSEVLLDLNERNLPEALGIQGGDDDTRYFCPGAGNLSCGRGDQAIDWNCDGDDGSEGDVCGQAPPNPCNVNFDTQFSRLGGADDWHNLNFKFRASSNFAALEHGELPDGDPDDPYDLEAIKAQLDMTATPVPIDIMPGIDENFINLESRGVIPVAIITTDTFNASTVDPLSVKFGPDGAPERHNRGHIKDVDGDGDLDLLLHFRTQETGIAPEDTEGCLTGETSAGTAIQGCDSI